jgi:hypothetical protein
VIQRSAPAGQVRFAAVVAGSPVTLHDGFTVARCSVFLSDHLFLPKLLRSLPEFSRLSSRFENIFSR